MSNTLVALYDNLDLAHAVLCDLQANGFAAKYISLVAPSAAATPKTTPDAGVPAGGESGSMARRMVEWVSLTLPDLGPIIASGPLAALLGSTAGTMIGTGGLCAALVNLNVAQEKASRVTEAVHRGKILMVVQVIDSMVQQAVHVMAYYLPVNIQHHGDLRPVSSTSPSWNRWHNGLKPHTEAHHQVEEMRQLMLGFDPTKTEPRRPQNLV